METIISADALFQRMKRAYKKDGNTLKKSRPAELHNLGEYHIIQERSNMVVFSRIDISELYEIAIDKGVVAKSEKLSKES